MAEEIQDKDLAEALKQSRRRPRNFALIGQGASVTKLLVSKKPIRDTHIRQARQEFGGNKIYRGTCIGQAEVIVFRVVEEEPSIPVLKLKAYIAEQTGLRLKPRYEVTNEAGEVDDDD